MEICRKVIKIKKDNYTCVNRGIGREKNKELILNHIKHEGRGIKKDFIDAFPELKHSDITNLLSELKRENKIKRIGSDRAGYWESQNNRN